MAAPPVLIVGAGPTGLVLALWLTRLGIPVRIIDRNAEAGTTSRALAVQARTLELYRQVGLADAVVDGGIQIASINFWVKGRHAARIPLTQIGQGLSRYAFALVFPQDAHEELLIERLAAEGVRVERQTELLGMEQHDGDVRATLRRVDGSEETCSTAYLAGCDGASSTVRETLGIAFPGGTYSGVFYVADVEGSGPTTDQQLHVDLEDADFVLVFPLKGQGRLRLVGRVRDAHADTHESLTFDEVRSRAIEHLRLNVTRVNWFSTYRVHHRVAPRFRDRRVFLLGDAAHIHSPVGGQGMNTGIGDAVNVAWKLAAVLKNDAPPTLLDTYEPERMPFAQRLVATTDRAFTIVAATGPLAQLVRTRIAPRMVPILFRIPAARQFMFKTLSQIVISYRDSPLSDGQAGRVHGGDRLPWVETGEAGDNFAPLTSLSWQVHVYGTASAELSAACADCGLPLHTFEWQLPMHRVGLERQAAYLIRPDGYVALADREANPARLRRYLTSRGLCRDREAASESAGLR